MEGILPQELHSMSGGKVTNENGVYSGNIRSKNEISYVVWKLRISINFILRPSGI